MRGIGNARLLFLEDNLIFQILGHPFELSHHHLKLVQLTLLLPDLKFLQADKALTCFHTQYSRG
ncbi:hypothetical protein D3C80_1987490 [compost metagenome]